MLKITLIETPDEQKLVLEGKLIAPDLSELKTAWEGAHRRQEIRRRIVDLRNTTFIDPSGEQVLIDMKREGAQFIACGVSTTHQLKRLGIRCQRAPLKCR
jgi:anti-anti-sigma regulatory factor